MKILLLCSALVLSGCASRHFVVCMQTSAGAGCAAKQFTAAEARDIGRILAAQPIAEDIEVWIVDLRKHQDLKTTVPKPKQKPLEGDKL